MQFSQLWLEDGEFLTVSEDRLAVDQAEDVEDRVGGWQLGCSLLGIQGRGFDSRLP